MPSAGPKSRATHPPRTVIRHRVRDAIAQMITDGRFRPGEKLVQLRLARHFGVSLGVVREALFELRGLGLVETVDNHGVLVRKLDLTRIREFHAVREVFDGLAARECCGRLTAADAAELHHMAEEIYTLALTGRDPERTAMDRKFHLRLAELSGNQTLVSLVQQHLVLGKVLGLNYEPERTRAVHLAIVDTIRRGDAVEAERLAREHVGVALHAIEAAIAAGREEKLTWVT
jgi:DNA-binding GntR family transcriptional regulator